MNNSKSPAKTPWSSERLQEQYRALNQEYWHGELPPCAVRVQALSRIFGVYDDAAKSVAIDVEAHESDDAVRDTLLHEMAHVADSDCGENPHGYGFWEQLERLLAASAPITVGCPEMPNQGCISPESVPERFALCRRELKELAKEQTQLVLAAAKGHSIHDITDREIVGRFEDAAYEELTWMQALAAVSYEYGLLDVGGEPRTSRCAELVVAGKVAFEEARSEMQEDKRYWQSLEAQEPVATVALEETS